MQRFALALLLVAATSPHASAADDLQAGLAVYSKLCASCHGAKGEGVAEHYARPLIGDKSVGELTELIERTMPEGEPEKCVGRDSRNVAAYLYDAFYSPLAQARNRPPQIEQARLTVRQYRETVSDLVGSFRWTNDWGTVRGLKENYGKTANFKKDQFLIEPRIDPIVKFYFGEVRPGEKPKPKEEPKPEEKKADDKKKKDDEKAEKKEDTISFSTRWTGSVFAPDTGEYEFTIRSENSCELFLNDERVALIDALVHSGSDVDHQGTIRLLGGRAYMLRLEHSKSKKKKEKTASVVLLWRRPGGVEEVIDSHFLSPVDMPERYLCNTPFPPDDRSLGYERGNDVTKAWDQATTDGAVETAEYVTRRLNELAKVKDDAADRPAKLKAFAATFVERAFRRPLTPELRELYIERPFRDAGRPEHGVELAVLLALKSPRFLFRELDASPDDPYSIASRLSFTLWDSLPDKELLEAASRGKLKTQEQIRGQAVRMSADARTTAKLRAFVLQWLKIDPTKNLAKDAKQFDDFDPKLIADLRTSLDLQLIDVLNSPECDFRRLLLDDETYMNGRLAKFYGFKDMAGDAPFKKVKFEADRRAGVVTHPLLMTTLAYLSTSSPIHRGVLLSRSVLGRVLMPPPEAVVPLPVDLHPNLSTRQRVALQTKSEGCASCHTMINNLGFALENFDAVGRYRERDEGNDVDASGSYRTRDDRTVQFHGGRELATFLADSPETHEAVVEAMFEYLVKQPTRAYGLDRPERLRQVFASQGFNLRKLATEIAVTAALPIK